MTGLSRHHGQRQPWRGVASSEHADRRADPGHLAVTGGPAGRSLDAGEQLSRAAPRTITRTRMVVNPRAGWSLDEQFGLDIDDNLLVRSYIVGKHAIRLPGADDWFYDGPEPYERDCGQSDRAHGAGGECHGGVIFGLGVQGTKSPKHDQSGAKSSFGRVCRRGPSATLTGALQRLVALSNPCLGVTASNSSTRKPRVRLLCDTVVGVKANTTYTASAWVKVGRMSQARRSRAISP